MDINEIFQSASRSLRSNKVRTFLTMLGVIIGVFSVISLVSIVKGVENFITEQFSSLGSNLVLIAPGRVSFNQDPGIGFINNKLSNKQVELIDKYASDYIVAATPNIRVGKTIKYKSKSYYGSVVGVNHKIDIITNLTLYSGKFFDQSDVVSSARVAIIGPQVKKELFGNTEVLGKNIKIDNVAFEIIGVLTERGFNADERVIIPYTTAQDALKIKNFSGISAKAREGVDTDEAVDTVKLAMLRDLKSDEFTVLSQQDILRSINSILRIISIGLSGIAAISLVVGGIGIMNIMLVSVNERIREIGLRKAVGATSRAIGTQFLIEAMIISMTGGAVGILLGLFLTLAINTLFPAEIPMWSILLGLVFSIFVGLVFGTYPAIKASKKDPIEALRYE